MSTFRVALSSLMVGFAVFLLVSHRAEVPGISMVLFQNPEFWVAVGLVTVLVIFVWNGIPRMVGRMLDTRATAIANELNEAQRLREEAASVLAGYVKKVDQVESEAAAILAEARAEAERYAKELRAQLRIQIDRRAQMAKEKIEQAEAAALAEIRNLAADQAAAAAEKLIVTHMDERRHTDLVQDSIQELPEHLPEQPTEGLPENRI